MRDLRHLKRVADYSSCDASNLNDFLSAIHPEYSAYTYTLLNNHVDKDTLRKCVNEEVLTECGVKNSIDRRRIIDALKGESLSFLKRVTCETGDSKFSCFLLLYRRKVFVGMHIRGKPR